MRPEERLLAHRAVSVAGNKTDTRVDRKVDVVVALESAQQEVVRFLRRILECGEQVLGRLLVVDAGFSHSEVAAAIAQLAGLDSRVTLLGTGAGLGRAAGLHVRNR